jgi:hypothetical protein
MSARLAILSAVLATALAAGGCSMFRAGEAPPRAAALNGDDGRMLSVVDAITQAAPRGDRAYAEPMPNELAETMESRSVLFALHLASYRTEASAEAGWRVLTAEEPGALTGLHPRIETVDLGPERGIFLRLKAGPLDSRAEAASRCATLESDGYYCQAVDFEGQDIAG